MVKCNEIFNAKENLVRELVKIKLQNYFTIISEKQYKEKVQKIYDNERYTREIEKLSIITFKEVVNRAEDMIVKEGDIKILFNEKVTYAAIDDFGVKFCDILLVGKFSIEVIKIEPLEDIRITAYENKEMKLLGLGAINKYICRTGAEKIRLTIIEPNILLTSVCEQCIEDLIHYCQYSIV